MSNTALYRGAILVNWGSSKQPDNTYARMFNRTDQVKLMVNRQAQTVILGQYMPEHTTDLRRALDWEAEGTRVFGLPPMAGKPFVSPKDLRAFLNCAVFFQIKPKTTEYRVHVAFGEIIYTQVKEFKPVDANGAPVSAQGDPDIWSIENGYRWVDAPQTDKDVEQVALAAFSKSGLDYGAFNIMAGEGVYLYEVVTAPALQSTGLTKAYGEAILKALDIT